jgi:hypothetical protein
VNARLPSLVSFVLHLGLLALLSLVTFRARDLVPPPAGMAIEIVDLDHAMPLPDPVLAKQQHVEQAARAEVEPVDASAVETSSFPAAPAPSPAPQPVTAQAVSPPSPTSAPPMPALGPGPVARPQPAAPAPPVPPAPAPTHIASPVSSPSAAAPVTATTPAPSPPRRLDAAALARSLGQPAAPAPRPRLNSAAIGSAIGQAVPKGVAGLSIRQRTNLADMIRSQITPCWNPPQAEDNSGHVTIVMRIRLGRDGGVLGTPALSRIGGQTAANGAYANALAGSVRRAILRCAPLKLPPELYDAWADVELNFDPRDIS